ncbi:MAG TPA: GGDEF domain-containing protein [Coriobacteriia bacterium]|nr:GGDEF domain-containing protein [Coriobacteriia bacterium]
MVSVSRFAKAFLRGAKITWRERPTRRDIEALQANIERVGLVIRVRWALVAVLSVFTLVGASIYGTEVPWSQLAPNIVVPAAAIAFVCLYNAYYHLTYRRLGNVAFLNHAQLLFDIIVVTVLVYYSGGVNSWFYAMYGLFILEAAFILPRVRDTWIVAVFSMLAYAVVLWGEFFGLIRHVEIPFTFGELHLNQTYVSVRYLWQVTMLGGVALVATVMTSTMRAREAQLAELSVIDERTGLYDRKHFLRTLAAEAVRAEREARPFAVILADIDDMTRFNRVYGVERADRMIQTVAERLEAALKACCGHGTYGANVLSRYGGEEFAVLLLEGAAGGAPGPTDAEAVAEALRRAVEDARVAGGGVTVSVGVACYPANGPTADALLAAADEALHLAQAAGGNRVRRAEVDR